MSKFEITRRNNGEYQFRLRADNGEIVLSSEGYMSKSACENAITSVKQNSLDRSRFDAKMSLNGQYYFNLKAANGQVIATSELYASANGRNQGIEVVQRLVPLAAISDQA